MTKWLLFLSILAIFLSGECAYGKPYNHKNISYAEDIETTIRAGQAINLSNTTIIGNIDLSNIIIKNNINIVNSIIKGRVKCDWAIFEKTANFGFTDFLDAADFRGANFNQYSGFRKCRFAGDLIFEGSNFEGYADFGGSYFAKNINFIGARFERDLNLEGCRFFGNSDFAYAKMMGSYAGLIGSRFNGSANFEHIQLSGYSDFRQVEFLEDANFKFAQFGGNVDLTDIILHKKFYIYGSKFDRLEIKWTIIKNRIDFESATYRALIRNYRNLEWFSDANDCYYDYRKIMQDKESSIINKLMDYIAWLSCGYGVRPGYTLFWIVALILACGTIYNWRKGLSKTSSGWEYHSSIGDAIYFSANVLIGSVASDYRPKRGCKHLVVIERFLGWLLLALLLLTLGNVTIRYI